jgi:hypothetical protein
MPNGSEPSSLCHSEHSTNKVMSRNKKCKVGATRWVALPGSRVKLVRHPRQGEHAGRPYADISSLVLYSE